MDITKRNGTTEPLKLEKISSRIKKLTYGLHDMVDPDLVSTKVVSGLYDGVSSTELDQLSAETAASMITTHPDYGKLAARIAITALYKDVPKDFSGIAKKLYEYINPKTGEKAGMISDEVYEVIKNNADALDAMIVHDRDFNFDYFGFMTLRKSYLLKINGMPAETPQHLYMRVAVGIWRDNLEMVQKTYDMLSQGLFTHATPTLFNAGTNRPQLSSCFLLDIDDDSIPGIYKTLSDCAKISQSAGGIGINIHKIRAKGSYIKGTNGYSNGIIPMLRVFNETARYVDQGGGKRKGSIAVYLEPWHGDVFDFLDLRKNQGKEELRARDLFLALWIPDLFMQRVEQGGNWTLFSPEQVPGLIDAYDSPDNKAFTELYEKYEAEGKGLKTVKARELWEKILDSQIETGTPYMLYKDACNYKSNQKNLGTIKSSNLCLAGDTLVDTSIPHGDSGSIDGTMLKLGNVVEAFKNGAEVSVASYNIKTDTKEYKKVINAALMSTKAKVLKITDSDTGKSIVCTPDHMVYTKNRGYVIAAELVADDILEIK